MRRYNQKYIGIGPMVESLYGQWVKHDDYESILETREIKNLIVIKDLNIEIGDLQSELQHTSDDLEDSRRRGFKLFTLLVISTTLNLITVAVVTLTMMGKI